MRPGMWTTAAPGETDDMILRIDEALSEAGGYIYHETTLMTGYGDRYWITFLDGFKVAHDAVEEGFKLEALFPYTELKNFGTISLEDAGDWGDASYNPNFAALEFEDDSADSITMRWEAAVEFVISEPISTGQISAIAITGLKRFTNVGRIDRYFQQGVIDLVLTNPGGVRTVVLSNNGQIIATGSRSGDGIITLSQVNRSGVGGILTVAYTADLALGALQIIAKWPREYQVHFSTSALSFPRAPEATVEDDDDAFVFNFTSDQLASGTYNVAIVPVSETGTPKAVPTATDTQVITSKPDFVIQLFYLDGSSAATRIRFFAPDATSTYNIYTTKIAGCPVDLTSVAATESAGAGEHIKTLPTFGASATGVFQVLVRTVDTAGTEEKVGQLIEIEFASGVRVIPSPNTPEINTITRDGLLLTVVAGYNARGQKNFAAKIQLFVVAETAAFVYGSPQDTVDLAAAINSRSLQTLTFTVPATGFFKVAVRALALDDVTQDKNVASARVHLSDDDPPEVTDLDVIASKGGI